jgi:hypothetical protein
LVVRVGKGSLKLCKCFFLIGFIFWEMWLKEVFSESMCFFDVVSCPSSLWCPKWWRRFLGLFYFLGRPPQRIVSGFCWCETLQKCFNATMT